MSVSKEKKNPGSLWGLFYNFSSTPNLQLCSVLLLALQLVIAMQQPLCLAWDTLDSGGGASLQIENAQLKLHFSSCMLVLSFE